MILVTSAGAIHFPQGKLQGLRRMLAWGWFVSKCLVGVGLCVLLAWGVYTGYGLVREADYFRLRIVHIVGNQVLTHQDVHYLLNLQPDASLFQLDLPRMGDRLDRHPWVKTVTLRRQYPDTLTVVIEERQPSLVVLSNDQGMLVDTDGVVLRAFSPAHDSDLPELKLRQPRGLAAGMRLQQEEVQRALELMRTYKTSPLAAAVQIATLTVEESGASVWELASYPFTIRLGAGNIEPQLGRLLPVLHYIAQQRLAVSSLDLSYQQRVVIVPVKS